jgi:hypothetical protein
LRRLLESLAKDYIIRKSARQRKRQIEPYSPKKLEAELRKIKEDLPEDARKDLESGDFIFGINREHE